MERWYKEGNINYVQKLEMSLSRALAATVNVSSSTIIGKRVCSSQVKMQKCCLLFFIFNPV